MDTRQFHKRLYDAASRLMPDARVVVCAVSGGADSIALLRGLHAVNTMRSCGWTLHVAHLHHALRDEADADEAFVRETAGRLGLACVCERADVQGEAARSGQSIEEAARRMRYAFLERVALEAGAKNVATGHHLDDQAETVLHRIVRGTGLEGLIGMRERRPIREGGDVFIVRPLLSATRDELIGYLANLGQLFRYDATNDDPAAATRNAVRHRIMPLLREALNPEAATALVRLAAQAERAQAVIREAAESVLPQVIRSEADRAIVLSATGVAALPRAVRAELVLQVLRRLGVGMQPIGFERVEAAVDAASGDGRRRRIELPGGVIVERRGREVHFRRE